MAVKIILDAGHNGATDPEPSTREDGKATIIFD